MARVSNPRPRPVSQSKHVSVLPSVPARLGCAVQDRGDVPQGRALADFWSGQVRLVCQHCLAASEVLPDDLVDLLRDRYAMRLRAPLTAAARLRARLPPRHAPFAPARLTRLSIRYSPPTPPDHREDADAREPLNRREFLVSPVRSRVSTARPRRAHAQGRPITASHSVSTFVYGQHLVAAQKKFFEEEGLKTPGLHRARRRRQGRPGAGGGAGDVRARRLEPPAQDHARRARTPSCSSPPTRAAPTPTSSCARSSSTGA